MDRKSFLKEYLIKGCKSSAIYYAGKFCSIKLIMDTGEMIIVSRDRHLRIFKEKIPDWDPRRDFSLVEELHDPQELLICEADKYEGQYTYTITYLNEYSDNCWRT